jgi:F-type H+-transporting ATPase subunit delta
MASFDDQEVALAGVYASSLLSLAQERKEEADVEEELEQLCDALKTMPYLSNFLTSPTVKFNRRRDALEKMFRGRTSQTFLDGLQILNRNDRLGLIRAISERYKTFLRESLGRLKAVVQTAAPLSAEHEGRLREAIKRRTGKDVEFEKTVDPNLIGGMVLQVGDRKVDASLSRKLQNLSDALMERASREVLRSVDYVA